ncbi:MAG: carbohydrate ABC transporter permease, partial [Gammaproteobacteria bacterium]
MNNEIHAPRRSDRNYRLVKTLMLVFLGIWVLITLFPFYWQIITALKSTAETNRTLPTFWPDTL